MKYFVVISLLMIQLTVRSQSSPFPPAQGPPSGSGSVVFPVYINTIYTMVDNYLRDSILPPINDSLRAKIRIPVSITHRTKQLMPYMSQTTFEDRPNEKKAVLPYEISYKLNITGFPDRYLKQNINIHAYCRNWANPGGGNIRITAVAEKAQLAEESFLEQVIDAVTLENLTTYIDRMIDTYLPGIIVRNLVSANIRCNCISLETGEPPAFEGVVNYYYKTPPAYAVRNGYSVSIKKIKKLSAVTIDGKPLFVNPESFQIRYYVNQKSESSTISGIAPGQERVFPENSSFVSKPLQGEKIVIITAIDWASGNTDAGHIVLTGSNNFGVGINKVFIQRSYRTEPIKLENGTIVKGAEVKVNAYEVTVEVKRINPNEPGVLRN